MKKLKELIKNSHKKVINDSKCLALTEIESSYKNVYNIPHYNFFYCDVMNKKVGKKIADAYDTAIHNPNDIFIKTAYEQLAKEIVLQFEFLQNSEMKIEFEPYEQKGEPYHDSFEMLVDIHDNYHMYFFKTESGFGESTKNDNNIMLQKTGIYNNGYELLINDIFRIIHDIFGHATYGYGFGPIEEDFAWMVHSQMFSPLARAAVTTETRGQNCWVNFGPHLRNKKGELYNSGEQGWISPAERPFAEQKMILLPKEISGVELSENKGEICAVNMKNWNPFLNIIHA